MRRSLLSATAATAAATTSLGLCAGGALAKTTHPSHPTRPAAAVTATLHLGDVFRVAHRAVDVPGRAIAVTGTVSRDAPGEHLTLEAHLGRRRVAIERLRIHPGRGGRGRFAGRVTAPRAGRLTLAVYHAATARLPRFHATRPVTVVAESTRDPLYVSLVQQRLAARHVYIPFSGRWDLQTELAVTAYHRLIGRGTSPALDGPTLTALLDGRGTFPVRYPHNGRHVEGNLSLQLVALVDGAAVHEIYPISSGKPSTPTILGNYRIYMRTPGYLPDGMYYSDFFIRGYALHGYDPAPDYPASHGCMRLPISDAISAFDWLALGDWVDVYGSPGGNV